MEVEELKDKHKGERCFLIGSGPSVNDYDLSKLYNENIIVASYFYLHREYPKFNNVYYCYSSKYPCNRNQLPEGFYRKSMRNKKSIFFFDKCFKTINKVNNYYPEDRIYFMTLDKSRGYVEDGEELITNVTKPLTRCGTIVADFMLPLIYYMGFSDTYVIGCDCTKTKPNQVPPHFYDNKRMPQSVYNTVKSFTSGFDIKHLNFVWEKWRHLYEKDNRHIYNLNPGGNLESLERKKYESIINST